MVYTQLLAQAVKLGGFAVVYTGQIVKAAGSGHRPFGNGIGVDMAMAINNP
jgi:hypothetical protein